MFLLGKLLLLVMLPVEQVTHMVTLKLFKEPINVKLTKKTETCSDKINDRVRDKPMVYSCSGCSNLA